MPLTYCNRGLQQMHGAIWGQTRYSTRIWGQARCPIYRSGTFNVKRSTLNFQRCDRKGAWWPGYGDRHDVWGLAEQIEGQARYSTRTWGQARCPIYRSGTFNVKRSTLNFQRCDRKGACWAGYGDRHDVWGLAEQIEGQARYSTRIWGQARCPIYQSGTFNVKRSTLNFQRGDQKGACWAAYGDRHGVWERQSK